MGRTLALILLLLAMGNLSHQQLLDIEDETEVDEYLERVLSIIRKKLSVDSLPEYAQEDGSDLINELRDDLINCKAEFEKSRSLEAFKDCVVEKTEEARTEIWDFKNALDCNTSHSSLITSHQLLIGFITVGWLYRFF